MCQVPQFSGGLWAAQVGGEADVGTEKSRQRWNVGLHSRLQPTNMAGGAGVSVWSQGQTDLEVL